jgi:hypothetical protein
VFGPFSFLSDLDTEKLETLDLHHYSPADVEEVAGFPFSLISPGPTPPASETPAFCLGLPDITERAQDR